MGELVHSISWAQQPDVQFMCDGVWGIPSWTNGKEDGVFIADVKKYTEQRHYTWTHTKVTCPKCLILAGPVKPLITEEEKAALDERLKAFVTRVKKRREDERNG